MASSSDEGKQEQHDKNKEEDLGDGSGACCDAKEPEDPGHDSYDQKYYCPP